jgi:hypothetical protein
MAGDDEDIASIDTMLTGGLPAFIVAQTGGAFVRRGTNSKRFDQSCRVKIFCVAGYQRTQVSRSASATPTVNPGIEDLVDWAAYYGVKAIEGVADAIAPRPLAQRWLSTEPGKYVAVAEIEYMRRMDCWDDDPTDTLQSLGIVRDPTDEDELFDPADNVTPQSDDPDEFAGGVYTL